MKHNKQRRGVAWLGLLLAFALVVVACGDDDAGTTTTAAAETTTTKAAEETTTTAGETTTTTEAGPACEPSPAPTSEMATEVTYPEPTDPEIQYGGEVIYANEQEPPTLNTFIPGGNNFIVSIVGNAYWTGVATVDGFTLERIPVLVTELPTVANGGVTVNADCTMTVRYNIVPEAMWADGTSITGDDFQFTYEMIMDEDLPIAKTVYEDIISTTPGEKTFEYTLAAPTTQFEFIFGVILPKHDVEGSDFVNDYNDTMWLSGGPFMFESYEKGQFLKVVRNPNYWRKDPATGQTLPYLDSVVFQFVPDSTTLVNAFKEKEVDIINPPPSIGTIEELQALAPQGAQVEVLSGAVWEHLNFQFGENRFFKNGGSYNEHLEYRQAVAHLTNKELLVDEILAGQVEPIDSYVDVFSPTLSQGSWAQYDYDPQKAADLLNELCSKDGVDCATTPPRSVFSTTAGNAAREQIAQLLSGMFADVSALTEDQYGFPLEFTIALEPSTLFFGETTDFGSFDLGEWAWVGAPGFSELIGMHDVWDGEQSPPAGYNYYRYGSPAVTGQGNYDQGPGLVDEHSQRFAELRDLANSTVDETALIAYIAEMENILADQAVFIPLYARLDPGAAWSDRVGNFKHNPTSSAVTWNMELWYSPAEQ
ncbi:MAG: ABC transporter substrate-binding protein [Acidimicrobiia bacterium]|nr:MAG: ABC transporter substrate-binding protein [Acidimicrobiia bacterium]